MQFLTTTDYDQDPPERTVSDQLEPSLFDPEQFSLPFDEISAGQATHLANSA